MDPLILVNAAHPLPHGYAVELSAPLPGYAQRLERTAAAQLLALLFRLDAGERIVAVSGYRPRAEQQRIWDESLRENGEAFTRSYVALPGCSEHETGLAVDLALAAPEIDFLRPYFPYDGVCGAFRALAAGFGFIERYPAGKEQVTGIACEPWHFRYVGAPHAARIAGRGLTLEEYLAKGARP